MRCACGFTVPAPKAPSDLRCNGCGGELKFDTDDYLLHRHNNAVPSVRPGQVEMSRLVERLISEANSGVIEGPVGVGKSKALMIPAMLAGKRIVISTAKKQLQHQVAHKDGPDVARALDKPETKIVLLKGKSNYACRMKASEIPDPDARDAFVDFLNKAEVGDQTEYLEKVGPRPKWWYDVTAEDCLGQNCRSRQTCGYWRAKQQAKVASIIVANHHVVAFDLKFGPFKLLPEYDVLIIDEAHQAPAAFRGAFGVTLHQMGHMKILRALDNTDLMTGLENTLDASWKRMFELLKHQDGEIPANPFGEAGDEVIKILETFDKMATKAKNEAGGVESDEDGEEVVSSQSANWEEIAKYEMLKKAIQRPLEALRTAKEPDQNTVVYVTTNTEKRSKTLTVAPISVGAIIGPKLESIPTVIVTSATLSINGNFDDIKHQLGMTWDKRPADPAATTPPKKVESLIVQSPFDYRRQAVLYTPKHLPLPVSGGRDNGFVTPERDKYLSALTTEVAKLIRVADGNTFVLFTATTDLNEVHTRLQEEELKGIKLIPQKDDAEATLAEFMRTPRSVILGLKSFWEGVDVVGDKLRMVVITKLPFPTPSEPVLQARARVIRNEAIARGVSERDAEGLIFRTLQIPQMITDLRQGVGRLIRSTSDRGVCAILDGRVWTGSSKRGPTSTQSSYQGYGDTVIKALGFSQRTADFNIVAKFMAQIQEAKAA